MFEGMRTAQFSAWSLEAASSYLDDLETARRGDRNLLEEKYIHMMKTTEPLPYSALLPRVVLPSDAARDLAKEVSDLLLGQARVLFEDYPNVADQGRPLYSESDHCGTSVETYQFCELLTYSEKTLARLKEHIIALNREGKSLARMIMENTVCFLGYKSLEEAEASAQKE